MSNFRLYPVPESKLSCLIPLLTEIIETRGWTKRNAPGMLSAIARGYDLRMMAAYTDSLDNPRILVVLSNYPTLWDDRPVTHTILLHVSPEKRGSKETNKIISDTITSYAKLKGSVLLCGNNRIGHNNDKAANFWLKAGYTAEETLFVKEL